LFFRPRHVYSQDDVSLQKSSGTSEAPIFPAAMYAIFVIDQHLARQ